MILSGPKACRGSTNDASIFAPSVSRKVFLGWRELTFPAFLHSLPTAVGNGLLIPKGMLEVLLSGTTLSGREIGTRRIVAARKPTFNGSKLTEYEGLQRPIRLNLRPGIGP
jgi:hypothetical protein